MTLRALDLFCGAGGVAKGLQRAGFHVTGVDIKKQPRYCGDDFIQAHALGYPPRSIIAEFDFVWASPPCQGYTALRHARGTKGAPHLIEATRNFLEAAGATYCIENVEEAAWDMRAPVMLCGSMFGLGAQGHDLQRHRLFETNFRLKSPSSCRHHHERPVIGVYGGHARCRAAKHGGRGTRDVWAGGHKAAASQAMGIDWMTLNELSEAIPPAYSEYIGRAAIQHIEASRVAA